MYIQDLANYLNGNENNFMFVKDMLIDVRESRKKQMTCKVSTSISAFDEICQNNKNSTECNSAKLCCWSGTTCKGSSSTGNFGNIGRDLVESKEFQTVMKDAKKPQTYEEQNFVITQMKRAIPQRNKSKTKT